MECHRPKGSHWSSWFNSCLPSCHFRHDHRL
jgi:hypothetical protein